MLVKSLVITAHWKLAKSGKYEVANRLYELLRRGYVCLDLGDIDDEAARVCDAIGLHYNVSLRSGMARYWLQRRVRT